MWRCPLPSRPARQQSDCLHEFNGSVHERFGRLAQKAEQARRIAINHLGIIRLGVGKKCRLSIGWNAQQPTHGSQILSSPGCQILSQVLMIEAHKRRRFEVRLDLTVFAPPGRSRRGAGDVGRCVGRLIQGGLDGAACASEQQACADDHISDQVSHGILLVVGIIRRSHYSTQSVKFSRLCADRE